MTRVMNDDDLQVFEESQEKPKWDVTAKEEYDSLCNIPSFDPVCMMYIL